MEASLSAARARACESATATTPSLRTTCAVPSRKRWASCSPDIENASCRAAVEKMYKVRSGLIHASLTLRLPPSS